MMLRENDFKTASRTVAKVHSSLRLTEDEDGYHVIFQPGGVMGGIFDIDNNTWVLTPYPAFDIFGFQPEFLKFMLVRKAWRDLERETRFKIYGWHNRMFAEEIRRRQIVEAKDARERQITAADDFTEEWMKASYKGMPPALRNASAGEIYKAIGKKRVTKRIKVVRR